MEEILSLVSPRDRAPVNFDCFSRSGLASPINHGVNTGLPNYRFTPSKEPDVITWLFNSLKKNCELWWSRSYPWFSQKDTAPVDHVLLLPLTTVVTTGLPNYLLTPSEENDAITWLCNGLELWILVEEILSMVSPEGYSSSYVDCLMSSSLIPPNNDGVTAGLPNYLFSPYGERDVITWFCNGHENYCEHCWRSHPWFPQRDKKQN